MDNYKLRDKMREVQYYITHNATPTEAKTIEEAIDDVMRDLNLFQCPVCEQYTNEFDMVQSRADHNVYICPDCYIDED